MGKQNRRTFVRKINIREKRQIILIATEGKITEREYFTIHEFKPPITNINVVVLPNNKKSSPKYVLKRMQEKLTEYDITAKDEAWLVVDKDNWKDAQLKELHLWSISKSNRGLAVSNPSFEYWLLLHFEKGNNINTQNQCICRLKKYCPDYDSSKIPIDKFSKEKIVHAITRAKQLDSPPCSTWPTSTGTTIYKLVEKIIQTN